MKKIALIVPLGSLPSTPTPRFTIRFDNGNTVTIRDGWIQSSSPELTAMIDTLAATLPACGSVPFILDEDFNIAHGLIRMAGAGKIVRHEETPPLPPDVIV